MNRFSDFSIKSKLIISIIFMLILALGTFSTFMFFVEHKRAKSELSDQAKLYAKLIADYAITPLIFTDKGGAEEVLSKLDTISNIKAAVIYDDEMKRFASYLKEGEQRVLPNTIRSLQASTEDLSDQIVLSMPIVYKDQTYGAVLFYVSTQELTDSLMNYAVFLLGLMTLLSLISLFVIYRIQEYITSPIIDLAKTAKEISLSEDYSIRAEKQYLDEVGQLYDDFNKMLDKIEQRGREREEAESISRTYQAHLERLTNELEDRVKSRTIELQDSFNQLQSAQAQLVESEKMSALGNLVAGVAHEVNTPLGISITAASIFKNEIKSIKEMLDENKLSKSSLEHFLETINEADEILVKNLDRAAQLVKNFKKISVDQSSEDMRNFELNTYLKEVISTFKSELKHRPVELELNLDERSIEMHSYPGAVSQIVVNMLQNALLHAFDEDQKGKIILETHYYGEHVSIIFKDTGKGIDESVAEKIFEPFVTTKRNKGGTGLGLNITYNLVTQHLHGSIHLDTEYKDGASFIINIPCVIAEKTA